MIVAYMRVLVRYEVNLSLEGSGFMYRGVERLK